MEEKGKWKSIEIVCRSVLRQPNTCRVNAIEDPLGIDLWTGLSDSEKERALRCATEGKTFTIKLTAKKRDYIKRQVEAGNL